MVEMWKSLHSKRMTFDPEEERAISEMTELNG
jgi:hypothetical protein